MLDERLPSALISERDFKMRPIARLHDSHHRRDGERGQILVIMAVGIVTMLAMTALIVDGGNAFANQRATQNGSDASANAGALILAQNVGTTPTKSDADVEAEVTTVAALNLLDGWTAYYTDVKGRLLNSIGNAVGGTGAAVQVGSGSIPPCNDPTTCVDGRASGVRVYGNNTINTYIAALVGMPTIGINTTATAVAGYMVGACPASAGCDILPVTIPTTILTCDGSNNPAPVVPTQYYQNNGTKYIIPLCKAGPGNVGWLDWTPTAGGTSELADAIDDPNNPAVGVPAWHYLTSTGNVNAQDVENEINDYAGEIVLIPQFDATCDVQPAGVNQGDCPAGHSPGTGSNNWYHLPSFVAMRLASPKAAYITGNNAAVCDTGNGATSCIVGSPVNFITFAVVGPAGATGGIGPVGVQLIR
ncbi:MAG TPA: pilus assembly protein TadG-related protein [Candidatus Limnocylindrales bacterium]|nr:pilus assembly protein TadG-related protein [Candidatus Limnocylindrales bacterium]